jgi:hypothetical protein
MNKTAATHKGHCQICGSLQKLPKGRLSLHGYTVAHGFFSGVCSGARHLPFELSCDLIKNAIERASAALTAVLADQKELRTKPESPKAWVHHYVGFQGRNRSSYRWMQVEILTEEKALDSGRTYKVYSYLAPSVVGSKVVEGTVKKLDGYYEANDSLDVALKLNESRAKWLEHEVDSLRRYIAWQTRRVNSWKAEPDALIPVDAKVKDKEEFKPTEPAY